MLGVLFRALTYASVFIAVVLVYLPARTLAWAGVATPAHFGLAQGVGSVVVLAGASLALWSVGAFVALGRGTPAPFDPPRRLVVGGPYRYVRNPMYVGATLALTGASLVYEAWALAAYALGFALLAHLFVVLHEERALAAAFGHEYERYRQHVDRWWPRA